MTGRSGPALVGAMVLWLAVSGCTAGELPSASVTCGDLGGLTLVAQAVPQAEAIPCFPELPFAYRTTTFDVEAGRAEIGLSHAVLGADVATLTIARRCVDEGRVVADAPAAGVRRSVLESGERGGVTGHLVQGLGGACLVVTVRMDHPDGRRALADLDDSWNLMPRSDLAAALAHETGGRLQLRDHAPGPQD